MKVVRMKSDGSVDRKRKKFKPPPPFRGANLPVKRTLEGYVDEYQNTTRRDGFLPNSDVSTIKTDLVEPSFSSSNVSPSPFSKHLTTLQSGEQSHKQSGAFNKDDAKRVEWNLVDAPTLPDFHPLERNAICVENASPAEVASRVSKVFYDRSIDADYDNVRARAVCVTVDHVEFVVRLYRAPQAFKDNVIVEVQRRRGFSLNFHNDTVAILSAAQGNVVQEEGPGNLPLVSDSSDEDEWDPQSAVHSLQVVSRMLLSSSAEETQDLAITTLASLVDAAKTGDRRARAIAKTLLGPGNEVGEAVLSIARDIMNHEDQDPMIPLKAFEALSIAIVTVNGDIAYGARANLRPLHLFALRHADSNVQMAHFASKSLKSLLRSDQNPREFLEPLQTALAVGQAKHAELARQAAECIKIFKIGVELDVE